MGLPSSVLKAAIREAEKSAHRHRLGAVVFKGKHVFGLGHNEVRTSSAMSSIPNAITAGYWPQAVHAEVAAILSAGKASCKRASILVIRLNNQGELMLAKPCKTCLGVIEYVGIRNIYYSTNKGIEHSFC